MWCWCWCWCWCWSVGVGVGVEVLVLVLVCDGAWCVEVVMLVLDWLYGVGVGGYW